MVFWLVGMGVAGNVFRACAWILEVLGLGLPLPDHWVRVASYVGGFGALCLCAAKVCPTCNVYFVDAETRTYVTRRLRSYLYFLPTFVWVVLSAILTYKLAVEAVSMANLPVEKAPDVDQPKPRLKASSGGPSDSSVPHAKNGRGDTGLAGGRELLEALDSGLSTRSNWELLGAGKVPRGQSLRLPRAAE